MDQHSEIFKDWMRKNRLRSSRDEQGFPVAIRRSRKFPLDHLYDGFNDGVGFHITLRGKREVGNLVTKLAKIGIMPKNRGDFEANFFIPWSEALPVAKMFRFVKGKPPKAGFKPRADGMVDEQMGG